MHQSAQLKFKAMTTALTQTTRLNKHLLRQISEHIGIREAIPAELEALFESISASYDMLEKACEKKQDPELELLFSNIQEVIFSVDMGAYTVLQISQACEKVYGYTIEEFKANPNLWFEVVVEEDKPVIKANDPVMHAGQAFEQEYRIVHKNGSIRWVMSRITPTIDSNGRLSRIDGITSDITERKNQEQRLRISEAHLQASQQIAKVGSWQVTTEQGNATFIEWTDETYRIFGYTPREVPVTMELFFSHLPAADREMVRAAFEISTTSREVYNMEHAIVRKDGQQRIVSSRGEVVTGTGNGNVRKIIGTVQDVTEQKKTEETIRSKEAHLKASQHIAKVGSWEVEIKNLEGIDGNSLQLSDTIYQMYGYDPGELAADPNFFFSMMHPEDQQLVYAAVEEAVKTGRPFDIEYRIFRKDGFELVVHGRGEIYYDLLSGAPLKIIGTTQDITDRKKAELSLKQVEANLRNILENTDTAYFLLDPHATVVSFNPLASQLVQEETGLVLQAGQNYIDLMPEDRKSYVRNAMEMVLKKKETQFYEVSRSLPEGSGKVLSLSMHPILNENKEVLGLSVGARNITEQKHAQEQLRLSHERYELVTKATRDVIWDWHLQEDKIYRSESFEDTFGWVNEGSDSSGNSWTGRVYEEDRERIAACIRSYLKDSGAEMWKAQYRYYRANGELANVHDRGLIIRDKNGIAIRMVGAMRDVTQEKQLEQERDKMTIDLVQRNNALEQFAYIVSHNLRAPVANIIGLTDMVQHSDLDPETFSECLNSLATSSTLLDRVILDLNDILHVRLKANVEREHVSLGDIVSDIQASISQLIRENRVEIRTDFSQAGELQSVKSYLYSIFYNLISNSIKYRRPAVPPVIDIKSTQTATHLQVTFKDNGLGIDMAANAGKVFGLYKRFHQNIEGKGMGLFMVKTQVEALGGKIRLQSEVNKGCEFTIELPVRLEAVAGDR